MTKQSRGEDTRRRLLTVAEESFARYGYENVSVAQICAQAGVTKGAFYHHFPSKQALFLAVIHAWVERLQTQLVTALESATDRPAALEAMTETATRALQDARGKLPLFLAFWHRAARDPEVWQATVAPFREFEALITAYLQRANHAGLLHVSNPNAAARALVAQAVGVMLEVALLPDADSRANILKQSIEWLLRGMETDTVNEQRKEVST